MHGSAGTSSSGGDMLLDLKGCIYSASMVRLFCNLVGTAAETAISANQAMDFKAMTAHLLTKYR